MNKYIKYLMLCFGLLFTQNIFAEPMEVKVGILLPKTGSLADIGRAGEQGFEMAQNALKSKLDNDNYQVTFIYADSRSSPESAVLAVNKLINDDKVDVVIGDLTSTSSLAVAPIAQAAKIPMLSPSSTSDKLTQIGNYISRACFVDSFQGVAMARFALESLKAKTAVLLIDSDMDHSRDVSKVFEKEFTNNGGKIIDKFEFSGLREKSFLTQLKKIRALNPNVVYAPIYYSQMGIIFKEAKDLHIKSQFLGTDAWDSPQLFRIAQGSTAGSLMSNPFSHESPLKNIKEFRNDFKRNYQEEPSSFAALSYDSILILNNALSRIHWPIKQTELSEKINNEIVSTKNLIGVTGELTLDANRNVKKPNVVILKLNKSESGFFATYTPK